MDIHRKIAEFLVRQEYKAQMKQKLYFKPLPIPKYRVFELEDVMPNVIKIAKPDKAKILKVFYEIGPDRAYFHIVFDDEYFPNSAVDKIYRELRKAIFGRTADVESVELRKTNLGWVGNFISTYVGPNVYETSVHLDGTEPYTNTIYVDTWNHLMSCLPAPQIVLRYGYKETNKFELVQGTREDAEKYAGEVS